MSTEDQSRKTKKGRTEERRRKESGSLLVWVLRTGRSSMVEPARAYNYPATIAQSFFAPHKPHHHNKVASRRWGGDVENCRPASLALLLDCIMSKFTVAPKPLAQPSTRRFHVFGAAAFIQESSQRSSNLSWFDHVPFACASTQSKFVTRIYEGKSLSSIMPSITKVIKVSDSPCQERELKVNSQLYDLMSSKPSDTRSVPMSVRDAAVLERTLQSALESYNFQLRTMTALFRFSWRLRPDSPGRPLVGSFPAIFLAGDGECSCHLGVACGLRDDKKGRIFPQSHGAFRRGSNAQSVVRSHLPAEGSICACHS